MKNNNEIEEKVKKFHSKVGLKMQYLQEISKGVSGMQLEVLDNEYFLLCGLQDSLKNYLCKTKFN